MITKFQGTDGASRTRFNQMVDEANADIGEKANTADLPTHLPNPSALTVSQGYGGSTGTYNGSAAVTISVPKITLHTSDPGTVSDGELWAVY